MRGVVDEYVVVMDATIKDYINKTIEAIKSDPGFGEVRVVIKDGKVYDVKEIKIRRAKEIRE
jgi:hypothetical protein